MDEERGSRRPFAGGATGFHARQKCKRPGPEPAVAVPPSFGTPIGGSEQWRQGQAGYLRAAGIGALAGLGLSLAIGRILSSLLFDVRPSDPVTIAAVVVALGAATWLASFFPSRRSTRVSPMETMRVD